MVSLPESPSVLPISRSASSTMILSSNSDGPSPTSGHREAEGESDSGKAHMRAQVPPESYRSGYLDNDASSPYGVESLKATDNTGDQHDVVRVARAISSQEPSLVDANFQDSNPLASHLLSMQTESMRVLVNLRPRRRAPRPILTDRSENVVDVVGDEVNEYLDPTSSRKSNLSEVSPVSRSLPHLEGNTRPQSATSKSACRPERSYPIPEDASEYSRKRLPPTPSPELDYCDSGIISPAPSFGHTPADQQDQQSPRRSVSTPGSQWDGLDRHAPSRASSSRSSMSCRLLTPTFGGSFSIGSETNFDDETWPEGSPGFGDHGSDQRYLRGIAGIHGILLSPKEQTAFVLPEISPKTLDPVQWGMAV